MTQPRTPEPSALKLAVTDGVEVSALWQPAVPKANACFVMAHGAGAGMRHAFMESMAGQLAARGVTTLRYQFPYMERGSKRPDPPKLCHATVRAAVAEAARRTRAPIFAGGRSFGGRMTSQAQAESPLPGVRGLIFLAFPLHPAKRPANDRAQHLLAVKLPMLFLQGTRDELADKGLLEAVVERLGARATLELFADADHSYHVRARSGHTDAEVLVQIARHIAAWTAECAQQF